MSCPEWDKCDKFKCHDERVCLNVDFWAKYWGSKERALKMESIPMPIQKKKKKTDCGRVISHKCYYCERVFTDILFRTRDHIIPKVKGGGQKGKNIIDACERCNMLKSEKTPHEFAEYLGDILNKNINIHISKDEILTMLYNAKQLDKSITPYIEDLYEPARIPPEQEWPDPEIEDKFDWSLSFSEMEKKYLPAPLSVKKKVQPDNFYWDKRNVDPVVKETVGTITQARSFTSFDTKFKKKYLHAHTIINEANPDLLRWIYDNILTKKEWTL